MNSIIMLLQSLDISKPASAASYWASHRVLGPDMHVQKYGLGFNEGAAAVRTRAKRDIRV
jgi:hypothetical protein